MKGKADLDVGTGEDNREGQEKKVRRMAAGGRSRREKPREMGLSLLSSLRIPVKGFAGLSVNDTR